MYFCTLMIYMLLFQDVWQLLSFSCDTCEMLSLPQSSSLYFRLQAFDFSPSSFCNKMCFTICKVLLKFASLQNWFYVSFCFLLQGFCFSFVKLLVFAKFCVLLNVVTCARVVILQLLQHFQAIDAPLSSCFFFCFKGFFWFVDLFIAIRLCCWEI